MLETSIAVSSTLLVAVLIAVLYVNAPKTFARLEVVAGDALVIPVGMAKVWAGRSKVRVPLRSITAVRTDDDFKGLTRGWKTGGTDLGGRVKVGSYRHKGTRSFVIAGTARPLVVIECEGAKYDRIVFTTEHPDTVVRNLERALPRAA